MADTSKPYHTLVEQTSLGTLLEQHEESLLLSFSEWEYPVVDHQPQTVLSHHSFAVLELEGNFLLCAEKCGDILELMLGKAL